MCVSPELLMKDVSQNHDRTTTKMVYVVIMLMRNLLKLQYEYFLVECEYHTLICLLLRYLCSYHVDA